MIDTREVVFRTSVVIFWLASLALAVVVVVESRDETAIVMGLALLVAPFAALMTGGAVAFARTEHRSWGVVAALAVLGAVVWLVYVGLYQHELPCGSGGNVRNAGCPTVYGYDAPLADTNPIGGGLLVGSFLVTAAWLGWRHSVPPLAIGAALAFGPSVLAWWTAQRGDNDGLWVFVLWSLPVLGFIAALVASVSGGAEGLVSRWRQRAAT